MCSGLHQIHMKEGKVYKTSFGRHNGHFEYKVMAYAVTGGLATFEGVMNTILAPLHELIHLSD